MYLKSWETNFPWINNQIQEAEEHLVQVALRCRSTCPLSSQNILWAKGSYMEEDQVSSEIIT